MCIHLNQYIIAHGLFDHLAVYVYYRGLIQMVKIMEYCHILVPLKDLRRILLAVGAEVVRSPIVTFLCQQKSVQTTLLHLPTAQNS